MAQTERWCLTIEGTDAIPGGQPRFYESRQEATDVALAEARAFMEQEKMFATQGSLASSWVNTRGVLFRFPPEDYNVIEFSVQVHLVTLGTPSDRLRRYRCVRELVEEEIKLRNQWEHLLAED